MGTCLCARVYIYILLWNPYVTIFFFFLFSFLACTSILDVDGKLCCDFKIMYNFIYKISALVDKQLKRLWSGEMELGLKNQNL